MTLAHRATEKVPTPSRRSPAPRATSPNPYADRLDQYERYYDAHEPRIREGCRGRGVSFLAVAAVHKALVSRTRPDGTVAESIEQLSQATRVRGDQVRRALAVLRTLDELEQVAKPRSGGRGGAPGTPTRYRVALLAGPVDNSEMGARDRAVITEMGARGDEMGARLDARHHGCNHGKPSAPVVHNSTPPRPRNGKNQAPTWADAVADYAMTRLGEWKPNNAAAYRRKLATIATDLAERWGTLNPHRPALADLVRALANGETTNRTTWVALDEDAARLRTTAGVGNTLALVAVGQ